MINVSIDNKTLVKLLNGSVPSTSLKNYAKTDAACAGYAIVDNEEGREILYMVLDGEYVVTASEPFIKSFRRIIEVMSTPFALQIVKRTSKSGRDYYVADIQ